MEQDHLPLAFQWGKFAGHAERWSIVEKEAFTVVEAIMRHGCITATREVHIYTDDGLLTYIFIPYGNQPGINNMNSHLANKSMRWVLRLSACWYVIEFVSRERSVRADIISPWGLILNRKLRVLQNALHRMLL